MNSLFMSGSAIPIGVINKNGWGVPNDKKVIESIIESFKTSKLRICASNNINEHHCDISNDDNSNIGRISDAWVEDNNIKVKVEVTKEDVIDKFINNQYSKMWSPYGYADEKDSDGWVRGGFEVKSLTFVNNPAWDNVSANELYASKKGLKTYSEFNIVGNDGDSPEPVILNDDIVLSASHSDDKNFDNLGDKMPEETIESEGNDTDTQNTESDVNEVLARLESQFNEEKARADKMENLIKQYEEKNKSVEEETKDETNSNTDYIPISKVEEMVQSAILNEREKVNKEVAINDYKKVCSNAGIEVKSEDLERFNEKRLTSEDIRREADSILKVYSTFNKTGFGGKEPDYDNKKPEKKPEDFMRETGFTVGPVEMWNKNKK